MAYQRRTFDSPSKGLVSTPLMGDATPAPFPPRIVRPHWLWWITILPGLATMSALALDDTCWQLFRDHVVVVPRPLVSLVFCAAWLSHVYQGLLATYVAAELGWIERAWGWGWQTFFLGTPSRWALQRLVAESRQ